MTKWEYQTVILTVEVEMSKLRGESKVQKDVLSEYGEQGWELVQIVTMGEQPQTFVAYMKRPA